MSEICDLCGLPKEVCGCEEAKRQETQVTVKTEVRRYGKMVTLVEGIKDEIKDIATELKRRCAAGGTEKNGTIEVQGDQKEKVKKILEEKGYSVKVQ